MKKINLNKVGIYTLGIIICLTLLIFSYQNLAIAIDNTEYSSAVRNCSSKIPDTSEAVSSFNFPIYDTDSDSFWGYQKIQDANVKVGYGKYPAFDKCMAQQGYLR